MTTTTQVEKAPCEGCGAPLRVDLVVCPQCNHRRDVAPEVLARSMAEAAAGAFAMDAQTRRKQAILAAPSDGGGPVTGFLSALLSGILPSPRTTGALRVADVVLTILCLPFLVAGLVFTAIGIKRWGHVGAFIWGVGGVMGTQLFGYVLVRGATWEQVGYANLAMFGIWLVRGFVRWLPQARAYSQ